MWWLSISFLVALAACGALHAAGLLSPAFGERLMPTASEQDESAGEAREYWMLQAGLFIVVFATMTFVFDFVLAEHLLISGGQPQ
jgi:hypothetical protein